MGEALRNKARECFPRSSPLYLGQRRLGLGQPERHVHGPIHLDGRSQLGAGLLALAGGGIERAKGTVAVRHEWTHAECVGQGEGLLVVGVGLAVLWWLTSRRNVAQEAQGIRLIATFLVLTSEGQRTLGKGVRLLQTTRQHMGLPQGEITERLMPDQVQCHGLYQRLREQWHGVSNAPA